MSETITTADQPADDAPLRTIGMLAEFAGPHELVEAARAIREKGYRKVEAFSPFPIHGIDKALAAPGPILPYVVLGAGLTGLAVAILMQWYMNATEMAIPFSGYDYNISGKPSWSLPANIPVAFELTILFSAFTAFLGMIAFNKLPRLSNPLFRNERFRKVTDDGFFLLVDADDSLYADNTIRSAFESIGSTHVEPVLDEPKSTMPGWFFPLGGVLAVVGLIPLVLIAFARGGTSETPRLSIWWDMDYQPKYKSQTMIDTRIFADGRAMRVPVEGTVSRGGLQANPAYELGYIPEGEDEFETALLLQEEGSEGDEPAAEDTESAEDAASEESAGDEAASEETAGEEPTGEDSAGDEGEDASDGANGEGDAPAAAEPTYFYPWVTEFPDEVEVSEATVLRGQNRYNIHCAVCHGRAGDGNGLVALRALELQQPTWRPPTSLHAENVVAQPVGKLYDTITNGNLAGKGVRGGMAGYREHISIEDRWAIVMYVKAMQKTRTASPEDLTEKELATLQ